MSNNQSTAKGYIDQLVVKAIEKKKLNEQRLAEKNKPKLEYVLFSQFDVLDKLPSKMVRQRFTILQKKGSQRSKSVAKLSMMTRQNLRAKC